MTIITKPITEKKNEKPLEKPLVASEVPGGECECVDHTVIDPNSDDVEAWLSSTARRRVSTATTICVFITALLVMSIGIIGGVCLYRQFSRHQMSRFRGWCGIPYERDTLPMMESPKLPLGGHPDFFKGDEDAEWTRGRRFNEEFDLDLEGDSYEEIHVPQFEFGHQGRFIHDFKANKTGIVDHTNGRCFVMPLNRTLVLPPRSLFDLIRKMWMGYYNVDTQVVRQTMRVIYPPVDDYKPLGRYISSHCANYRTYILEEVKTYELEKRSVGLKKRSVDAQLAGNDETLEFVEFAGNKIVQFSIIDHGQENSQH